jgi:hypothetical protein
MMVIKRDDIASIHSLDDIIAIFSEKGFTEYKKVSDTEIRIKISDEPTFLSIFQIDGVSEVSGHQKYLRSKTEYLILVTPDFENLIFVKKEFTKLDTERFRKFRINKSKITNTSLNKINGLNFNDVTSFDNLFDRKEVVKQFYDEFIKYRKLLIDNILGLDTEIEKERYAQIIVDRLIFLYFIQKKNLLDENENYLSQKLKDNRGDFFNNFLCLLFFKGLSIKGFKDRRLGDIPYLNGGLFRQKKCEQVKISIPDEVFETILTFFDSWNWYVDERADFGEEKSISPEILGHIFEKTVNQKESGAYYTPELITSYISETTIYPVCLNKMNSRFKQNYSTIKELFEKNSPDEISYLYNEVLKKLSVLDNACGSGAFLIAAQDVLIDIYSQTIFRLKNDPNFIEEIKEHNRNHELKLDLNLASAQEFHDNSLWSYYIKRMIITNNLYGVDIEEGAGEIGKLRLWLSMIAHVPENISLVEPLPNIEYNIRCGNSLIGYTSATQIVDEKDLPKKPKKKIVWNTLSGNQISLDTYQPDSIFHLYYDRNQLIRQYKDADDSKNAADLKDAIDQKTYEYNQVLNKKLFDEIVFEKGVEITEEAFANIKPFHWIMEFSDIFERGGFDIVVGNPPYVRQELIRDQKGLFKVFYPDIYQGTADLYTYFIDRSITLLHPKGIFSYIVANKWMRANFGKPLRIWLKTLNIEEIIDFKDLSLFGGATAYTCVIRIAKYNSTPSFWVTQVPTLDFSSLDTFIQQNRFEIQRESLSENGWALNNEKKSNLSLKIQKSGINLFELVDKKLYYGIKTGFNNAFIVDSKTKKQLIKEDSKNAQIIKPFLIGKDIQRYSPITSDKSLLYIPWHYPLHEDNSIEGASVTAENSFATNYPSLYHYLENFKTELSNRNAAETGIRYEWYALQRYGPNYSKEFENVKICWGNLSNESPFTIDYDGHYINAPACFLVSKDSEYVLGLLNSKVLWWYLRQIAAERAGGFIEAKPMYVAQLPIHKINKKDPKDKERHDQIVTLVKSVLVLNKQLQKVQSDQEKVELTTKISETDQAIDRQVYDLYGLTGEEIEIIENGLSQKGKC